MVGICERLPSKSYSVDDVDADDYDDDGEDDIELAPHVRSLEVS